MRTYYAHPRARVVSFSAREPTVPFLPGPTVTDCDSVVCVLGVFETVFRSFPTFQVSIGFLISHIFYISMFLVVNLKVVAGEGGVCARCVAR